MARRLLILQRESKSRAIAAFVGVPAMLLALGAVSSALDALQSLTETKSSSSHATGFNKTTTNPFDFAGSSAPLGSSAPASGAGGFSQISPATMSALLAAQSQSSAGATTSAPASRSDALKDLFSQIDADGDGRVSKLEFENALGAGGTNIAQADDVFGKMDKNGDGLVSLDEMTSALKGSGGRGHHHQHRVAALRTDQVPIRCCKRCRVHPARRSPTATARPRRR